MAAYLELHSNGCHCNTGQYHLWCRGRYAMVRLNFKGKTLLDILIMVPWALPGTVVAVNLILCF